MRLGITCDKAPFNPARYALSREDHFLLHDLRISEMFTRLRLAARETGGELLWFNKTAAILRRGEDELVRPDGIGVLVGEKGLHAHCLNPRSQMRLNGMGWVGRERPFNRRSAKWGCWSRSAASAPGKAHLSAGEPRERR